MRNRTKKEQREIDSITGLLVLVAGLVGWYMSGTLKGAGIGVGVGLGVIIIFSIWRAIRFKKRMQQSGIKEIDQMSGREFEEYIGTLFEGQGYRATYTPATGDFGADLILKRGLEVVVVQAKRHQSSVGIAAVQEVIPAVKMYQANAAWVVSNSYYTKAAVKLANSNHVRMINRDELIQMSLDLRNSKNQKDDDESVQSIKSSAETIGSGFTDKGIVPIAVTMAVDSVHVSANELETRLKEYRLSKARKTGKKAFHIFTNKTLEELVEMRPVTIDELRGIHGIGKKKIEDFGEELVGIIRGLKHG